PCAENDHCAGPLIPNKPPMDDATGSSRSGPTPDSWAAANSWAAASGIPIRSLRRPAGRGPANTIVEPTALLPLAPWGPRGTWDAEIVLLSHKATSGGF